MSMPSDADIDLFVRLMRQKLEKNSHKETVTVDTLPRIMAKLLREGAEFLEQLEDDDHDPNSLYECADIANFALLAFCALRSAGVHL
jgi:hypothetical protein